MPPRKGSEEGGGTAVRKTLKPRLVEVDYDKMQLVSRDVRLQEVVLHQAHWRSSPRLDRYGQTKGLSYSFRLSDAVWDHGDQVLAVELQYELAAFAEVRTEEEPKQERQMFELSCNWRIFYQVDESFKPAVARAMADFSVVNGQLNAFPYVRQFVQDIISRSGWPPLVLPVYRIPKRRPGGLGGRGKLVTTE